MGNDEQMCLLLETAPINILCADLELRIVYANPASKALLKRLEKYLPVKAEDVLGQPLDTLHKRLGQPKRVFSDPRNLPHKARIRLGAETLEILVTARYGAGGKYLGPLVCWGLIPPEKVQPPTGVEHMMSLMEHAPVNILCTDLDFKITYANPASRIALRTLEQHLPVPAAEVVGQSIEIFQVRAELERRLLADPKSLPHHTLVRLGAEKLDLWVSVLRDEEGEYIGQMICWEIVTHKSDGQTSTGCYKSIARVTSEEFPEKLTAVGFGSNP